MKTAMLILNTSPLLLDARVRKEAQAVAAAGHAVRVIALRQPGERGTPTLADVEVMTFPLWSRRLPRTALSWPVKYGEFLAKALARLVRDPADVYHAHDLEALVPAWLAGRLTGGRVVYDSHELFTERPIELRAVWRMIERFLLRRVDAVIAASEERAHIMHAEYGAPTLPTVVANCPQRRGRPARSSLRAQLPAHRRDARVVVYQGGLSPGRCLERLTTAAAEFGPDTILALVGARSPFFESVLRPLIDAEGLDDRVFWIPPVDADEVVSFIEAADLGVVIYQNSCRNNYYCAPNKLYDYCMAGLPVVGPDFPPIRRLVEEYGIGMTFDPERPATIAASVRQVLDDDDAYARAVAGCAAVADSANWETESVKLVQLYGRLEANRARTPTRRPGPGRGRGGVLSAPGSDRP
jgi:glycosyltransferase involved in cell wall biosynthesis